MMCHGYNYYDFYLEMTQWRVEDDMWLVIAQHHLFAGGSSPAEEAEGVHLIVCKCLCSQSQTHHGQSNYLAIIPLV